ncbi:hypothetical protein HOH67_00020 [Candidatus Peregrinibacteria bacterium]|nr:hypothetical protein [Candidatus Peregrinibacteria bacterium]
MLAPSHEPIESNEEKLQEALEGLTEEDFRQAFPIISRYTEGITDITQELRRALEILNTLLGDVDPLDINPCNLSNDLTVIIGIIQIALDGRSIESLITTFDESEKSKLEMAQRTPCRQGSYSQIPFSATDFDVPADPGYETDGEENIQATLDLFAKNTPAPAPAADDDDLPSDDDDDLPSDDSEEIILPPMILEREPEQTPPPPATEPEPAPPKRKSNSTRITVGITLAAAAAAVAIDVIGPTIMQAPEIPTPPLTTLTAITAEPAQEDPAPRKAPPSTSPQTIELPPTEALSNSLVTTEGWTTISSMPQHGESFQGWQSALLIVCNNNGFRTIKWAAKGSNKPKAPNTSSGKTEFTRGDQEGITLNDTPSELCANGNSFIHALGFTAN